MVKKKHGVGWPPKTVQNSSLEVSKLSFFFVVVVFVTEKLLFSSCLTVRRAVGSTLDCCPGCQFHVDLHGLPSCSSVFFFLSLPLPCLSFCPFLVSLSLSLFLSLSVSSLSLSLSLNLSMHQPIVTPLIFWLNYSFFFFFLAT